MSTTPRTSTVRETVAETVWRPNLAERAAQIYLLLWLGEGILRKWGPAGLGQPLYFARDGFIVVALALLLLQDVPRRRVPRALAWAEAIVVFLVLVQLIVEPIPVGVGVVGVRSFLGPLFVVHLCWRYCRPELFWSLARILLMMAPLEAGISLLQSLSPQQSWINKVGPDAYVVIFSSGEVVRASGTFTAAFGIVSYLMIALPLSLGMVGSDKITPRMALLNRIVVLPSLLLTCFVSGSRSAIFLAVACLVARLLVARAAGDRQLFRQVLRLAVPLVAAFVVVTHLAPGVLTAFQERFENAEQSQSTSDRVNDQLLLFTEYVPTVSLFGQGLGARAMGGIAAGSPYGWIENEPGRWIAEGGLLGLLTVVARFATGIALLVWAWRWAYRLRQPELFLLGMILSVNLFGGLLNTQPTQQGATAITVALLLLPLLGPLSVPSPHPGRRRLPRVPAD
ncbi:hypothetical protein Kisp01_27600 [Kineosporia sp. NBRC 101677]|uniref:hypothetical protein n=1 Tax=Kineosporia sp. NBRC 101677 TaxID=3032197 RepID=UPI0024A0B47A|nr:hypothetical protein [Kineosporia sp. NBRC 101677]GLY15745.1 hypothetical protein Kisp01_27600 [Kineosporia sp. NBRC 101677]